MDDKLKQLAMDEYRLILKKAIEKQPENEFVNGCAHFFIKTGFLTPAQVEALNNTRSKDEWAALNESSEEDYSPQNGYYGGYGDGDSGPGGEGDPAHYFNR